uniref:Uncharacterized protein n=1 Tax=Anguilla anguilla TaxID=7936 RepID=A0A0E9X0H6_ANGAN
MSAFISRSVGLSQLRNYRPVQGRTIVICDSRTQCKHCENLKMQAIEELMSAVL